MLLHHFVVKLFQLLDMLLGDIVEITNDNCKCMLNMPRIKRFIGRADDMLKLKGVKVYLGQIEDFILSNDICSPNYEVVLTKEDYIDKVSLNVETCELVNPYQKELEEKNMMKNFKDTFGINANINLLSPFTLERKDGKPKKLKDER